MNERVWKKLYSHFMTGIFVFYENLCNKCSTGHFLWIFTNSWKCSNLFIILPFCSLFFFYLSLSLYVVVMSLSGKDNNYILSIWLCCVNFQHWFYYEGNKNFMYARSATGIYIPRVFYQQYIHRNKEIVGSNQNLWVWCLMLSLLKALANWGHRLI